MFDHDDEVANDLMDAAKTAADHIQTLEVLVDRAERALEILAEWYVADLDRPYSPLQAYARSTSPDTVAQAAYSRAVREELSRTTNESMDPR